MSVYELGRLRVPVAGGGYLRMYPRRLTEHAIAACNADGRPAVLYVHPWELDPGQPRVDGVGVLARIRHHVGIGRHAGKLRRVLQSFPFSTARQVLGEQGVDLDE